MLEIAAKLSAREVNPITSASWSQLVTDVDSSVFHSPQWMSVIEKTYGLAQKAYVVEKEGKPIAGVAWCPLDDLLGKRRVSLAFSDYCNVLAVNRSDADGLAKAMIEEDRPWVLRTLGRNLPGLGPDTPVKSRTEYKWHFIDLAHEPSVILGRLSSMARRGVNKAGKNGVLVRKAADKRELRDWYFLHLKLRKNKHLLLPQPYAFFENIWDEFVEKGQGFLLLAYYQDKMIAGTFYILWKGVCYYKFNASHGDYLSLRPNNILTWLGILEAKDMGCHTMDLGRSNAQQSGLLEFKRGFGAVEEDLYSITFARDVDKHEEENRQLLRKLTSLFVQDNVPDSLVEQAGTLLYRYFS